MQHHDAAMVEMLLQSAAEEREGTAGRAGAVPARSRGRPTARPLAPRARAAAAADRSGTSSAGRRQRAAAAAPRRPQTAPAGGRPGSARRRPDPESTPVGHTQDLGLKRSIFWPAKVIEAGPIGGVGYRSTVGREGGRVGFWEAGERGPPGGYRQGSAPGRPRRSANDVYGYTKRPTLLELRQQRKEERERERRRREAEKALEQRALTSDGLPANGSAEPEPEPEPAASPAKQGAMIYVNTRHKGMQVGYSAEPSAAVTVTVTQFTPTKSRDGPARHTAEAIVEEGEEEPEEDEEEEGPEPGEEPPR